MVTNMNRIYDPKKAEVTFFDTCKNNLFIAILLEGNVQFITESYSYLCYIISDALVDEDDINKKHKILYIPKTTPWLKLYTTASLRLNTDFSRNMVAKYI